MNLRIELTPPYPCKTIYLTMIPSYYYITLGYMFFKDDINAFMNIDRNKNIENEVTSFYLK